MLDYIIAGCVIMAAAAYVGWHWYSGRRESHCAKCSSFRAAP